MILVSSGKAQELNILRYPVNALSLGMGNAVSVSQNNNIFAMLANPAQAAAQFVNEWGGAYSNSSWISAKLEPEYSYSIKNVAGICGLNIQRISEQLPNITFAFGYARLNVEEPKMKISDIYGDMYMTSMPYELSNQFTLSAAYRNKFCLAIGVTIKDIRSYRWFDYSTGKELDGSVKLFDYGMHFSLPVTSYSNMVFDLGTESNTQLKPLCNIAAGFAILNTGEQYFSYNSSPDLFPLPRIATAAWSIALGADLLWRGTELKAIKFEYASDARGRLLKKTSGKAPEYDSWPGNLNYWKNSVLGQGAPDVENSVGWSVHLAELLSFYGGHQTGALAYSTGFSWGIHSLGVVKLLQLFGCPVSQATIWGSVLLGSNFEYTYSRIQQPDSLTDGVEYQDFSLRFSF